MRETIEECETFRWVSEYEGSKLVGVTDDTI